MWFYRLLPWMWDAYLPGRGDPFEALWQIEFWRHALLTGEFQPVSLSAMYPLGMHHMTTAHIGISLILAPIALVTGSAVALNIGFIGGLVLCFLGARNFLRHFTASTLLAGIGATIFTFALGRTFHIHFHINIAFASAFGVWMADLLLRLRQAERRRQAWGYAICSGVLWGAAIVCQPYSLFLCGVLFLLLGNERRAWRYAPVIALSALLISAPLLIGMLQGTAHISSLGPSLFEVAYFGSAPANYLGWGDLSPWQFLKDLTRSWRRVVSEQHMQNWGALFLLLIAAGVITVWRFRYLRAHGRILLALLMTSLILSLGPLWQNPPSQFDILKQVNVHLWKLGSQLKPNLFTPATEDLAANSLPLPAIVPVILAPRYEYARVSAHYSMWAGLASIAIAMLFLNRLPRGWAVAIGCLWLLELLPAPQHPQVIPAQPHPADVWAADQKEKLSDDRAVFSPPGILYIYSHDLAGGLRSTSISGPFIAGYLRYMHPWIVFSSPDPLPEALTDPAHAAILRRA
ncbi:MAG: hypothetical protein ACUVR3_12390 [Candidatus Roseilinea sp.]